MNQYPRWKYFSIYLFVFLGIIYTIPNFYGESPSLQISNLKSSGKFEQNIIQNLLSLLNNVQIKPKKIYEDDNSIKIQFDNTEEQLKSKNMVQKYLGEQYVVAFNMISNSPQWFSNLSAFPMFLGLDLRGGVHFLLQIDMTGVKEKNLTRYAQEIKSFFRKNKIRYRSVKYAENTLSIQIANQNNNEEIIYKLEENFSDLEFTNNDNSLIFAKLSSEAMTKIKEFAIQQNLSTLRNRVNELGVAEPIVQQSGEERIVVQLPGVQDTAQAKNILGRTAALEVRLVDEERMEPAYLNRAMSGKVPYGLELLYDRIGTPYLLKKRIILDGERISDAQPGFDSQTNEPAVHLTLDGRGASLFQKTTRENVGKRIAMVLTEKGKGEVVTAPVVRQEIGGGRVQISGSMTTVEARDISLLLRSGALAAPMEIIEERTVGPSLGADNIKRGFKSTWIGFIALAIFIAIYYHLFGVISVTALIINLCMLVSLLSILQATLTLPGFAAIALTLGMAIDSNVLINERIREEIRNGVTPQAAIAAGYERAWATILDSNITTLIAGIALFSFGSGPIRGFAVVHCLGILTSMFSAVLVSRSIVNIMFGKKQKILKLPIGDKKW